jgi:hypothetical protein
MHFIPCFNLLTGRISELCLDFGDGLDKTLQQDLDFSLLVVGYEAVDVGFVFLCAGYFIDELLDKSVEKLF